VYRGTWLLLVNTTIGNGKPSTVAANPIKINGQYQMENLRRAPQLDEQRAALLREFAP